MPASFKDYVAEMRETFIYYRPAVITYLAIGFILGALIL